MIITDCMHVRTDPYETFEELLLDNGLTIVNSSQGFVMPATIRNFASENAAKHWSSSDYYGEPFVIQGVFESNSTFGFYTEEYCEDQLSVGGTRVYAHSFFTLDEDQETVISLFKAFQIVYNDGMLKGKEQVVSKLVSLLD